MGDSDGEGYGRWVIKALIALAVQEKGFSSESALARGMGIPPAKLNRWKNGVHSVPPEMVRFALVLVQEGTASGIRRRLEDISESYDAIKSLQESEETLLKELKNNPKAAGDSRFKEAMMHISQAKHLLGRSIAEKQSES